MAQKKNSFPDEVNLICLLKDLPKGLMTDYQDDEVISKANPCAF